ncbi:MAG: hypothetical protein QOE33_882 [Acidobacteriota bacterium]|nr:hypothetical protein [Acidobacteriota bacterium]
MPANNPTFEEVDKHIQSADLSAFQAGGKHHLTAANLSANPAAAIPKICAAYNVVKPILQLLSNLPLIPKKWKDAIKAFMSVLDMLCAG